MSCRYSEMEIIEGENLEIERVIEHLVHFCYLRNATVNERLLPIIKEQKFTGKISFSHDYADGVMTFKDGELTDTNILEEY